MSYPFDTEKLIELCRRQDVALLGVFGSVARGKAAEDSDVDLLVRFSHPKSLLATIALERQMAEAIGRRVDLVTEAALSPYIRDSALEDLEILYDAG